MNRILLRLALMLAVTIWLPTAATSQVSMVDGDWFSLQGPTVKIPILGPNGPCAPAGVGGCVILRTPLTGHSTTPNGAQNNTGPGFAAAPTGGGVPGADTNVSASMIPGGSVRVRPNVFNLGNTHRFTAVAANFAARQFSSSISYKGPATNLNVGLEPRWQVATIPASTRLLNTNNWLRPGNGMQGRVAATSTPVFVGKTITTIGAGFGFPTTGTFATVTLPVSIRYTNGNNGNAFGGTMQLLLNGGGTLWLNGCRWRLLSTPTMTDATSVSAGVCGGAPRRRPPVTSAPGWASTRRARRTFRRCPQVVSSSRTPASVSRLA